MQSSKHARKMIVHSGLQSKNNRMHETVTTWEGSIPGVDDFR